MPDNCRYSTLEPICTSSKARQRQNGFAAYVSLNRSDESSQAPVPLLLYSMAFIPICAVLHFSIVEFQAFYSSPFLFPHGRRIFQHTFMLLSCAAHVTRRGQSSSLTSVTVTITTSCACAGSRWRSKLYDHNGLEVPRRCVPTNNSMKSTKIGLIGRWGIVMMLMCADFMVPSDTGTAKGKARARDQSPHSARQEGTTGHEVDLEGSKCFPTIGNASSLCSLLKSYRIKSKSSPVQKRI